MACKDYLTVDELKALPGFDAGTATDAGLAMAIMAASDYIDKEVLGHTYNRAIRIYEENSDSTAATVQVTAVSVIITITDGVNAGTHTFTFAVYATMEDIVDVINDVDIGVVAYLLGGGSSEWMRYQPSSNLSVAASRSIHGIENWQILCMTQLSLTLSGTGRAMLFLPLQIATVNSVEVEGVALAFGTDYYADKGGWLIRAGCGTPLNMVCPSTVCTCHKPGCWACSYPCNVDVDFVPRVWRPQRSLLAQAISQFIGNVKASGGFLSETMGRYSYRLGKESYSAMGMLLVPLYGEGLVIGEFP
jgi:hypothetical protein